VRELQRLLGKKTLEAEIGARTRHGVKKTAAAAAVVAASLIPITLMRSDEYHFLGPATGGLPALIALSVMLLPDALTKNVCSREATRSALVIILCAIYLAPHGGQYIIARLTPDISEAWRGLSELGAILARSSPPIHSAAILATRCWCKMPERYRYDVPRITR
jgi:hypothetical protein